MRNVLITGGAGFIGSNFIRYLLDRHSDLYLVNLDALTYAGSLENLHDLPNAKNYSFVQGDICDKELVGSILAEYNIDTIVHFAAESHVDRSILGPAPFIRSNIQGTFKLLEAARNIWRKNKRFYPERFRFHHISTDEVYGSLEPDEPAFSEGSPYRPNSPYAASKAASDHLVRSYSHTYGLPCTITNCSNNYGPFQFPEKLIPLIILNAIEGKSLPIYGDGGQIRDWLYVKDHCSGIERVIEKGEIGSTYLLGGDNQPTNLEVVQLICGILDELLPDSPNRPHKSLITFVKDRPGHDRRYAMDITKMRLELNWQPVEDLESGLYKTVQWYLSNTKWLQAIRKRPTYQDWLNENYKMERESR